MIYYAGVGSRETPNNIMNLMTSIAKTFSKKDHCLRSGGANGADTAFEIGAGSNKQIFLPWKRFNKRISQFDEPTQKAYDIAEEFHPAWHRLNDSARRLQARNSHIILGHSCEDPVSFCVCWTEGGKIIGGTGQALRICHEYNIQVYNLAIDGIVDLLKKERCNLP